MTATNNALAGRHVLIILRHAASLQIVKNYVEERGGSFDLVVLDPIEAAAGVEAALQTIRSSLPKADIIVAGTKVYDDVKDGPGRLHTFLALLRDCELGQKPVCLTHLNTISPALAAELNATGLNLSWCENDNLKRDGMSNLGPLILQAAASLPKFNKAQLM